MASVSYITVGDFCQRLQKGSPVTVVDVRGDDRAGGHIKGSQHIHSVQFQRHVADYVRMWVDQDAVVFHCMMSQVRGPTCANAFLAACQAALKDGSIDKMPRVLVLEGGFQAFARAYSEENKCLFQDFEPRLYGMGWERD